MPEPLPETRALTDWKPRNRIQNERKTERQKEFSTCRSRAYYVSAGQKLSGQKKFRSSQKKFGSKIFLIQNVVLIVNQAPPHLRNEMVKCILVLGSGGGGSEPPTRKTIVP